MTQLHLAVRRLLGRARTSWLVVAGSAALATPWVVRHAVGSLEEVAATPLGAAIGAMDAEGSVARFASNPTGATGRHLGFDTSVYPGDGALRRWKEAGPYEWVGFYLPAPCHKDASWSGKRERLAELGFGTAVIYVGQQTWGRTPRPGSKAAGRAARTGASCNADFVTGDRGRREADDAIARTAAEGFPRGTTIFLDVERMERMPQAMRDYYRAWTARVLADGRFRPGVYVHTHNADQVHADFAAEYRKAGMPGAPTVWVANGHGFTRDKAPVDGGHHFAGVWQGVLDVVENHGGVRLPIDVNVAAVASPSAEFALAD